MLYYWKLSCQLAATKTPLFTKNLQISIKPKRAILLANISFSSNRVSSLREITIMPKSLPSSHHFFLFTANRQLPTANFLSHPPMHRLPSKLPLRHPHRKQLLHSIPRRIRRMRQLRARHLNNIPAPPRHLLQILHQPWTPIHRHPPLTE